LTVTVDPRSLTQLVQEAGRPLGVRELLRLGGLHAGQQTELKRALRELVRTGQLEKEGKRFRTRERTLEGPEPGAPARAGPGRAKERGGAQGLELEGILHLHRDGYGFVHPIQGDTNVFLPPHEASRALDYDRVRVRAVQGEDGRLSGRIVEVLERRRQRAVGTYMQQGKQAWVAPADAALGPRINVPTTQLARPGDLVKVLLGVGEELLGAGGGLYGEVTGSIGRPGQPSGEVLSVAYGHGFSDEFPDEVMAEADRISMRVTEEEARGEDRRDLRHLPLVTIDGADARDFDDAVYAEPSGGGWRLVVAIADVTHYVQEGSALDREALRRATSVYLPDRVLPMLPERLSNGICSLRPKEDRLCMVADLLFDPGGRLERSELYPAVMRSAARCTYEEVHQVLAGQDVPHRNLFRPHFENLLALSKVLGKMRQARGAIEFDLPEHKIVLDEAGNPDRVERRPRLESHRLIEECMLAANEAVARFFQDQRLPSVYRFHGEPNEDKLAVFAALAHAHGFHLGASGEISPHELNEFLEQLEGHPEQRALNQLLLRSMMQAIYSAEQVGHYGLGAEHYLHFTSPIRRYPDLLVHRLLKAHWARGGRALSQAQAERLTERLEEMAAQCSERERAALEVEREVVSFYATLLMQERVGEEFDATVSALADFGFFVELDELLVEGLVRKEGVGHGGRFDPLRHALVFPTGQSVRVGARVRVRLVSANLERRQLEFELVGFEGSEVTPSERRSAHPGFDRLRAERKGRGAGGQPVGKGGAPKRRPGRPGKTERDASRGAGPRAGGEAKGPRGTGQAAKADKTAGSGRSGPRSRPGGAGGGGGPAGKSGQPGRRGGGRSGPSRGGRGRR
jgi:ribonuclease R